MTSAEGEMPGFIRVGHQWTTDAWWSAVRCRLGRFGPHSRIASGLYALGRPGSASPVLVTASYRLSFDLLRREMGGTNCWILVLDTRGLGVGSAAASGLFNTDELVTRVAASRLARVVDHRVLTLPARAAGVIDALLVARATGFEVRHAPEEPAFGVLDTLALVPVELGRSLMWYPGFAFAALLYAGLGPGGVTLGRAFAGSWPLLLLGLSSVICGSLLAPVFQALVRRIPLWAHGAMFGCAATAALLEGARLADHVEKFLTAACWLFFPAAAGFMAHRFIRALPISGEFPRAGTPRALMLLAAALGVLIVAALVLSKLALWRAGP
jgi:hypothetical protein